MRTPARAFPGDGRRGFRVLISEEVLTLCFSAGLGMAVLQARSLGGGWGRPWTYTARSVSGLSPVLTCASHLGAVWSGRHPRRRGTGRDGACWGQCGQQASWLGHPALASSSPAQPSPGAELVLLRSWAPPPLTGQQAILPGTSSALYLLQSCSACSLPEQACLAPLALRRVCRSACACFAGVSPASSQASQYPLEVLGLLLLKAPLRVL